MGYHSASRNRFPSLLCPWHESRMQVSILLIRWVMFLADLMSVGLHASILHLSEDRCSMCSIN